MAESIVPTPSGRGDTLPGTRPVAAVAGLQLPLAVYAYDRDSSWLGWDMITGRWYSHPGQVVVNTSFLTQTGRSVGDTIALTVNGKPVTAPITGQVFLPNTPSLFTSWQTLGGTASGLAPTVYDIGLKPGTSPRAYATALANALGPQYGVPTAAQGGGGGIFSFADTSLIRLLTLLVAALAGLGVLSSVLIVTRERVHDLGIFKALGMTPRQAITMVTCWVIGPAVVAAAVALPAAILLHSVTMQAIGRQVSTAIPGNVLAVFRPAELLLLAASGLAIAAIGTLLPASWAAASRTITALRAE